MLFRFRTVRRARVLALAGLLVLLLLGSTAVPVWAQPLVVATTPDLASIAKAVSGGAVRVASLVPPGIDPEAFEPRPSHLALVRDAVLVLRVGLGYDEWLNRLLARSENAGIQPGAAGYVDLSRQIALLEVQGRSVESQSGHAHGAANPHYWLDPANGEIIGAVIAEALVRMVPEARDAVEAAQKQFSADLRSGIERWTRQIEPFRGAPVIAYHNGWPYFARRFRLNVVDVIEPKEGVPPSPTRLALLAAKMRQFKVRAILQEPFEPGDAARFLAERTGARVVLLAPSVGGITGTDDYLALFDRNVAFLAEALAGSQ